jgi:hypothetical protein
MSKILARLMEKMAVNRRGFLSRLAGGAVAVFSAVLGFTTDAFGLVPYACCNLCLSATGGCQGSCGPYHWAWNCCYAPVIFTVVSSVLTRRTLSTIGTDLPILTALLRPAQKVFTAAICARVRSL